MNQDILDFLLQLGYLEGRITTHGLYEKSVLRKQPKAVTSLAAKRTLVQRLEAALASAGKEPGAVLTVGLYLRSVRQEQSLDVRELSTRLGLSANHYKLVERDRLSPLKVPADSWQKFIRLFSLPFEVFEEMVRRTHRLVYFRASFQTTLARYDGRKSKTKRSVTLEQAAEELYARAHLPVPPEEEIKLHLLLNNIARGLKQT
jgi:transcriptional regulator with XRE-family HTH domain